jgi:hypothetical protein
MFFGESPGASGSAAGQEKVSAVLDMGVGRGPTLRRMHRDQPFVLGPRLAEVAARTGPESSLRPRGRTRRQPQKGLRSRSIAEPAYCLLRTACRLRACKCGVDGDS